MTRIVAVVALIGTAACGRQDFAGIVVNMTDNSFSPREFRVPVGGHVLFRNMGATRHNVMAVDGSWSTEAALGELAMPTGTWAELAFPQPGVFPFYCSFHATPDGRDGMAGVVVVGDVEYTPELADRGKLTPVAEASEVTRRVPQAYPDIQTAVDAADPGDLILIDEGTYYEEVIVVTPSLTLRGTDRNRVVLDGEFQRGNGIMAFADGVAVENLTAQNYNLNGIYWTRVTGYRGSYITAVNNGDYGIFAFDAVDGVIEHSYASGSPDAAYYIGQCQPCRAVLDNVIGEYSGNGYSGTNSGGDLYIVRSMFRQNGSGIHPNTFDVELLPPERYSTFIGNTLIDNYNGIQISGGSRNVVERNLILGSRGHGVMVLAARDRNYYPATDNVIRDNQIVGSGRADLALSGLGNIGNCFADNVHRVSVPWGLELMQGCRRLRLPVVGDLGGYFRMQRGVAQLLGDSDGDPRGEAWKQSPYPPPQPQMPGGALAPVRPAIRPFESHRLDLDRIVTPAALPVVARASGGGEG